MLGFSIGLRTLRAAQQSMDLVGQNVANAATPGYSRRLSLLSATDPVLRGRFGVGSGVEVRELRRIHDGLLETRLREQTHVFGRLDAAGSLLAQLEGFFQEPSENGLAARLDDLWNAFSDVSRSSGDASLRDGLVQSALTLGAGFRQVASQVGSLGTAARQGVDAAVGAANGLLREIATINERVIQARNFGATPADLEDERDRLLKELAEWVDPQVIDRPDGTVDVLLDGRLLVSGGRAGTLTTRHPADGSVEVSVAGSNGKVEVRSGRLLGYLDVVRRTVPQRAAELDAIARELIAEVNRRHTTAVPASGPYASLSAAVTVAAGDRGLPLGEIDLPFAVESGRLTVNVVNAATGSVEQHFLAVDPKSTTLDGLAAALDALPHVTASLDTVGRLRVAADAGYGFDFSGRLDVDPDDEGSFGSSAATLTSGTGPFALSDGDTIDVALDGGAPVTVTFAAADFADISQATAAEIAAVIAAQLPGATAGAADGRLVLRSASSGAGSSITITAVSNPALFAAGTSDTGADDAVVARLAGAPSDGTSGHFTVRALGDGTIGLTPGLQVALVDEDGTQLATFDVGDGYVPGDPIELLPGVTLSLTAGEVAASAGDVFEFDLIGDSDTSDVLVALQLGAFFVGRGAADVDVNPEIVQDPRRVAGSRTGEPGDAGAFFDIVALRDEALEALGGRTLAQGYGDLVAGVGLEVRGNQTASSAQAQLLDSLEARREEISGVNVDEEMLRLLEYQHLYQAAGRYLQSVSAMTEELFQLL